mmetsp:Transcript_12957/g.22867  ORF Transcript_12957/g.22867 Transcript_12957/m.22867 type:complete len:103 (-) Transcript_12957:27-335(-)
MMRRLCQPGLGFTIIWLLTSHTTRRCQVGLVVTNDPVKGDPFAGSVVSYYVCVQSLRQVVRHYPALLDEDVATAAWLFIVYMSVCNHLSEWPAFKPVGTLLL